MGLLIVATAKTLPDTNDALNSAMLPQVSSTGRRLRPLDRRLRQRQGTQYRVTAYFPPQVLANEPSLQNLKPGALMEPSLANPEREPNVSLALLLPVKPAS